MPNILQFDPGQFVGFFVIFIRIAGLMTIAPLYGDNNIPMQIKVGLIFLTSLIFFNSVSTPNFGANPDVTTLVHVGVTEFGVGLLMGFSARLLLSAIGLGGEIVGFQMGLGIANVLDPSSGQQVPLIGQINLIFTLMLFTALDGHLIFIRALAGSYQVLPAGGLVLSEGSVVFFSGMVANIFVVGLQLGAPMIVALMAANFSMGLIARSVPQLNVIVVGFPFTIGLGLIFMGLGFPAFIHMVGTLLERVEPALHSALKVLGG